MEEKQNPMPSYWEGRPPCRPHQQHRVDACTAFRGAFRDPTNHDGYVIRH